MARRIEAFSLIEMLVVLILSSIIVSIIYFMYYTVSTYQLTLIRKQRKSEDLATLYFLLRRDVDHAKEIVAFSEDEIETTRTDAQSVLYSFDSAFVLRKQLTRIDTFYGQFGNVQLAWRQKPISTYPSNIDKLDVEVKGLALPLQIHVVKKYDAASLVNLVKKDSLQ